jgi:hypothetical protein
MTPTEYHYVPLSWEEVLRASMLGVARNIDAAKDRRKAGWGRASECWGSHIQGALAELAFAKFLNVYWEGHNNEFTRRPDVMGCEVRWSGIQKLKKKPNDKPNQKFVLVSGEIELGESQSLPHMVIHGWLFGHEFETLGVLADLGNRHRPAWFVDADKLHPMSELQ